MAGHLPDLLGRASPITRTIASTSRDEHLTRTGGPQRTLALRAARRLEALWHRERPAALLLWLHYGRRGASLGPERAVLELLGLEPPKGTLEVAAEARRAARALEVAVEAWWGVEEGEGDAVALQLLVAEGDRLAQAWLALTAPVERPATRRRLRAVFGFARELGGVCEEGTAPVLGEMQARSCEEPLGLGESEPLTACWSGVGMGWAR